MSEIDIFSQPLFDQNLSKDFNLGEDEVLSPTFPTSDNDINQDNDFNSHNLFRSESRRDIHKSHTLVHPTENLSTKDTSKEECTDEKESLINSELKKNVSFPPQDSIKNTIGNTNNVTHNERSDAIQKILKTSDTSESLLQEHNLPQIDHYFDYSEKPLISPENTRSEIICEQLGLNQSHSIFTGQVSLESLISQGDSNPYVFDTLQQVISPKITNVNKQKSKAKATNKYSLFHLLRFLISTLLFIMGSSSEKKETKEKKEKKEKKEENLCFFFLVFARLMTRSLATKYLPLKPLEPHNSEFKIYFTNVWQTLFKSKEKNKSTKNIAFKLAIQSDFGIAVIETVYCLLSQAYQPEINSQVVQASLIFTYWIQGSRIQACHKEHPENNLARMHKEIQVIKSFLTEVAKADVAAKAAEMTKTAEVKDIQCRLSKLEQVWSKVTGRKVPMATSLANGNQANVIHQEDNPKKRIRNGI